MSDLAGERVGNVHRAVVLDLLGRALEEGYIQLAEYETRMVRVTEGQTVATLYEQVADLPPQFRWDPRQPLPKTEGERKAESANSTALLALAFGIASIPVSACFGIGAFLGIAAAVLGERARRAGGDRKKAVSGLVLGIVGILLSALFIVMLVTAAQLPPPESTGS